ncbi:MAG: hypothetical protein LBG48_04275, partial [Rickettsiales bacterium]|nr:hypothetical protein [Rickettsiales bacterium]
EIKLTAYHEAGHAVTALHCENSDPIYKATIISRGRAGGYVARLPKSDKGYSNITKASLTDDITIALGGRVAEEIVFGPNKITAGAISDIKMATLCAKNMVVSWGMNDKIGTVYCADKLQNENGFGAEASSDKMLELIDKEIKDIIDKNKSRAESILKSHKKELKIVADALIKYETLTGDEIKELVAGRKIRSEETVAKKGGFSLLAKFSSENMEILEDKTEPLLIEESDNKKKRGRPKGAKNKKLDLSVKPLNITMDNANKVVKKRKKLGKK